MGILLEPWFIATIIVVGMPLSVLMIRSVVASLPWMIEYPPKGIDPTAQSRAAGYIEIEAESDDPDRGASSGNAFRVSMDERCLHLVPGWAFRVLLGFPTRSIPWDEIHVTERDGDRATAKFGRYTMHAAAWIFERACGDPPAPATIGDGDETSGEKTPALQAIIQGPMPKLMLGSAIAALVIGLAAMPIWPETWSGTWAMTETDASDASDHSAGYVFGGLVIVIGVVQLLVAAVMTLSRRGSASRGT